MIVVEYMSLPASQYSVLDAERIERVDDNTFRCYVYRFKFFAFEVCPVLLVKVEEQPNGCCIKLLSCEVYFYGYCECFVFESRIVGSVEGLICGLFAYCSLRVRLLWLHRTINLMVSVIWPLLFSSYISADYCSFLCTVSV